MTAPGRDTPDPVVRMEEAVQDWVDGRSGHLAARQLAEAGQALLAERHELAARVTELERDLDQEVRTRDEYQEAADRIAAAVGTVAEIGEHSSSNDPWARAAELAAATRAELDASRMSHTNTVSRYAGLAREHAVLAAQVRRVRDLATPCTGGPPSSFDKVHAAEILAVLGDGERAQAPLGLPGYGELVVYRSDRDGRLVVEIDTSEATAAAGTADRHGVPLLRVVINDDQVWNGGEQS